MTDDSREVIRRFESDPRVRFVGSTSNSGNPFVQWNRGVAMTGGEYVWIAESDDYADPVLLETLVDRLDRFAKAGLAYCNSWIVDEENRILGSAEDSYRGLDTQHWSRDFVRPGIEECRRHLVFECTIPNASAVVFRRAMYQRVGGADESYRLCGDWAFWVELAVASDIVFVADRLNYFRRHAQTVRSKTTDWVFLREMARIRAGLVQRIPFSPEETRRLQKDFLVRRLKAWVAAVPLLGPLTVHLKQSIFDRHLARL